MVIEVIYCKFDNCAAVNFLNCKAYSADTLVLVESVFNLRLKW